MTGSLMHEWPMRSPSWFLSQPSSVPCTLASLPARLSILTGLYTGQLPTLGSLTNILKGPYRVSCDNKVNISFSGYLGNSVVRVMIPAVVQMVGHSSSEDGQSPIWLFSCKCALNAGS